jgi:hypothetical protein
VGRAVAAWPPIALLLVVEVLARSSLPVGRLRWVAGGGAACVATTAALASFHHMHEVALAAGESNLVAWLFPLTVDGLAVVASVALLGANQTSPEGQEIPLEYHSPAQAAPEPEPHTDRSADQAAVPPSTGPTVIFPAAFSPARNGAGAQPNT